ncbi:drug resistance transporter, EmrB/QacA subfamily [Pseudooceanicola antarcticus]|uniref:Drug resistance transporter, EmrB/QacA subfamily n=1 Tax=Pseudooceanicola antarcticus TaxID=1247613 RepID=A0A285ITG3_9RHOB|nr:MDR family MFS transporter [Pseudooceanicola antarcticus]PJE31951.1 EmrB/QacA family drug resistance transporter [Pseudooceanicola antarcticus]SNY50977.1 drug resistance transporter, EmrB/QacA subfamily [Pseudooceanicola antarcticus]
MSTPSESAPPAPNSAAPEEAALPDPALRRVVMIAVALTLFLASTGQSIVATALPEIVSDLGGLSYITWVVTAYLLASTIGAPIAGKLGDMYGRKIVLQCAIGIFLVGGWIAGAALNMPMLVVGRVIQGFGGGSLIVVSMAVVADLLPPRERAKAQGMLSGVFGVSTVLGPLAGGFLVQTVGWHWIFYVNIPFGVLAFAVLTRTLKSRDDQVKHKMDYLGAVLLMVLLSSTVLVATLGGSTLAWDSAPMLVLLATVVLALAGFIRAEARAAEPVLPLPLFRIRNFVAANGVNLLIGMAMFGTISFIPMFLQVVKGVAPAESGVYMIAIMAGLIGLSFTAGRVMTYTGRYKFLPNISTLVLMLALLMLSTVGPETPLWQITLNLFFVGVGIGPTMSVGIVAIQTSVPREHLGVGTASANMFRLTGGSVGTSIFGAIFNHGLATEVQPLLPQVGNASEITTSLIASLEPGLHAQVVQAFTHALQPLFVVGAGAAVLAFVASLCLHEKPLDDGPAAPRAAAGRKEAGTQVAPAE